MVRHIATHVKNNIETRIDEIAGVYYERIYYPEGIEAYPIPVSRLNTMLLRWGWTPQEVADLKQPTGRTRGKLVYNNKTLTIYDEKGQGICKVYSSGDKSNETKDLNMVRLVECWNKCEV